MHREKHAHAAHPEIIKRLRRAIGQLQTIVAMIEADKPCTEVAMQLQAAEKAIEKAKKTFIHDHIDHCLELSGTSTPRESRATIREFKDISKYL